MRAVRPDVLLQRLDMTAPARSTHPSGGSLLRRRYPPILCIAAIALFGACDPCTGVAHCSAGGYLRASGQIVEAGPGTGIDGVRIDVVRTGGIAVDGDSVSAVTRDGGYWQVEFSPREAGTLTVAVQVTPPNAPPYRLHDVRLETRASAGDVNLNERWLPFLYFNYFGEFFLRGTVDQRVQGAAVEFRRTAGLQLFGPGAQDSVYRDTTDSGGRVSFFPSTGARAVFAREDGTLIGDLTARLGDGSPPTVLRGLQLHPSHRYRDARDFPEIIRDAVGPTPNVSPAVTGIAR